MHAKGSSVTRRSAGIPAILVGLISSTSSNDLLDLSFKDLANIASGAILDSESAAADLPQVHAMNSLRSLFMTTRLNDRTDKYIVPAMELAVPCLESQV